MAAQLVCDMCQQEPAAVMQTNIENGDAVTVGNSCLLTFYLTIVAEVVSAMAPEQRDAYAEVIRPVIETLANTVISADIARTAAENAVEASIGAADYDGRTGPVTDENPVTGDMVPLAPAKARRGHG